MSNKNTPPKKEMLLSQRIYDLQHETNKHIGFSDEMIAGFDACIKQSEEMESYVSQFAQGNEELPILEKGDEIKLYGTKTIVKGFEVYYNDALNPPQYEIILLTTGRGDPFKRSLDKIELINGTHAEKRNRTLKFKSTTESSEQEQAKEEVCNHPSHSRVINQEGHHYCDICKHYFN